MTNILVIFTGGTIGSMVQGGYISPNPSSQRKLIALYQERYPEAKVRFFLRSPYTTLSENLSASHLNTLISCLQQAKDEPFDGIIITHGTDTLQYTAAALDLTIEKRLPILLVSADYPLDEAKSNGLDNFQAAINFLLAKPQAGVFVAYKNRDDAHVNVHLPTLLFSHREGNADIYSDHPYAIVNNAEKQVVFAPKRAVCTTHGIEKAKFCEKPNLLVVDSRPENDYDYDVQKYAAVILTPYHSGTLNTQNSAFQSFCLKAKEYAIPVFVSGVSASTPYQSSQLFENLSLIPTSMPRIPLFVKCWLAISLHKNVKDFVLDK